MQSGPTEQEIATPGVALRSPDTVMRLARMGAGFPTRLSFMRSLIRRMNRERWRIVPTRFELDDDGYGTVVYTAITPERRYSLIGYSQYLEPDRRTARATAGGRRGHAGVAAFGADLAPRHCRRAVAPAGTRRAATLRAAGRGAPSDRRHEALVVGGIGR